MIVFFFLYREERKMEEIYQTIVNKWSNKYFQFIVDHAPEGFCDGWGYYEDYWKMLSSNPKITWETVQQFSDKPWNFSHVSSNPNITRKIVQQFPDKHWNKRKLEENPTITWKLVEPLPDTPSRYRFYTYIDWEILQHYPDEQWDWTKISCNPCITWEIVQQFPDKPWHWHMLSENPNITWEQLEQFPPWTHPDPWNLLHCEDEEINRKFSVARDNDLAKAFAEWFVKSDVKRELIEKLWHLRNMEKWKGWGYE
jgi:hypothetical protein